MPHLNLSLLPGRFAVCQLLPGASPPPWPTNPAAFYSVTRTNDELSVVCPEDDVPSSAKFALGWRILKIEGPLGFTAVGILLSVVGPLADAGVSIFAISTFGKDFVLVKEENVEAAIRALEAAGHGVAR